MDRTEQLPPATIAPGQYVIDPGRSAITIATRHLFGLAPVRAALAVSGGSIRIAEPLEASGIEAGAYSASFRSGSPQRDRSVRSARFLNASRHPVISFASVQADTGRADTGRADTARGTLAGTLTVRGVSRPVTFSVAAIVSAGTGFTARAAARIDRTEFGITAARGLAGRYLDVSVEVTCVRS